MLIQTQYLRQFLAANTACLTLFVCACWVAWPSSVNRKLDVDYEDVDGIGLQLNKAQITWVVSLLDLGNAISPIFSSLIMNRIGRKNTLLLVSIFFLPTWLMVWDSTSLLYVYIARFLVGISKGLAFTAVPVYIGEISDHNVRGMLSTLVHTSMTLGVVFSLCIGPYVTYTTLNTIFSLIPPIFLVLFALMPGSPYYYIMKKDYQAAEEALMWFRPYEKNPKQRLQMMIDSHTQLDKGTGYWELVRHSNTRRPLLIITVVAFMQRLSGITTLIAYSSVTLPELSFSRFGPSECVIVFTLSMVITNCIGAPYMDILGRKFLLCVSVLCGTVIMALTSCYYYVYPVPTNNYMDTVPYVLVVLYGIAYNGIGNVPAILPSEYFTTSQRGYASAVAAIGFAIGSFITSKSYLLVLERYGACTIFLAFAIFHVIYLVFSYTMVRETKGKTFEEIQAKFYKKKHDKLDTQV